jgi:hypothetical protein
MRIAVLPIIFALLFVGLGVPQAESQRPTDPHRPADPLDAERDKRMEKARNEDRQKELKRDTVRLMELATELKQYVDRTNESVLSLEVIHKTEEIEKLARNIRGKMKGQ